MLRRLLGKNESHFRYWVYQQWQDNKKERLDLKMKSINFNTYWNEYKYWLKKEYKEQFKNEN
jgi:hypothetical protein